MEGKYGMVNMEKLLTLSALQGICCLWESMDADRKGGKGIRSLPISDVFAGQLWTGRCCYRAAGQPEVQIAISENHIFLKAIENVFGIIYNNTIWFISTVGL